MCIGFYIMSVLCCCRHEWITPRLSHDLLTTAAAQQQTHPAAGMGKARHPSMDPLGGVRQSVKVGKLNLVDLAGSERVHITGATGGQGAADCCTMHRRL